MDAFMHGPFAFEPRERIRRAGKPGHKWDMLYAGESLGWHAILDDATRDAIVEEFAEERARMIDNMRAANCPERVSLVDAESGKAVAHFLSFSSCGMTPGLIDDRARYWLRSDDRLYSRNVTLDEYAQVVAEHAAAPLAWIAGLLPLEVLMSDSSAWRAPTAWEIRHVVGEGSFVGISGAKAAELVGVTPQNFRKYTAADGASTRQAMSFAMWHLLLHKLGVQRA